MINQCFFFTHSGLHHNVTYLRKRQFNVCSVAVSINFDFWKETMLYLDNFFFFYLVKLSVKYFQNYLSVRPTMQVDMTTNVWVYYNKQTKNLQRFTARALTYMFVYVCSLLKAFRTATRRSVYLKLASLD